MSQSQSGPTKRGSNGGTSLAPLYKIAPIAALRDQTFYEYLALADALRDGRIRERKFAEPKLHRRLEQVHA